MTDERRKTVVSGKNSVSSTKMPSKKTNGKTNNSLGRSSVGGQSSASSNYAKKAVNSKSGSTKRVDSNSKGSSSRSSSRSSSASVNGSSKNTKSSQSHIRFAERSDRYRSSRREGGDTAALGGGAAVKPKKKVEAFLGFDYPFFMIVILLLAFGLIMMFSASYATAYSEYGDSLYYIKRQALFAVAGIGIMLVASVVDYHIFRSRAFIVLGTAAAVILMALVKVMPTEQGGSERWLTVGPVTFQPSEMLKFVVIVLFAFFTQRNFSHLRELKKGLLPYAVTLVVSCGLLMIQPHLSGTIIVFAIGFVMMYVAGVSPKYLIIMLSLVGALIAIGIPTLNALGYDYFDSRWLSFTNPEADIRNKTFQTYQSLVTIGSGGLFGLGFGNSRQKYSYLPMSRNDFIFSIICEELGFVGGMLVILLFVILVWRGFYISSRARDKFGMMLAFGVTFQIGLQALLNIAVVSNSMPNTGISLPFFSYGGSALLMQLGEMGVLLNISRKAELD